MTRKTIEVRKPRDIGDAIRAMREARGINLECGWASHHGYREDGS